MLTPETNSVVNQKVVSTAQYLRKKEEQEQKSDRRKNHTQNSQSFHLLENITDGFFALDLRWRFIYINQKAKHLFSKTQQDLIGKVIWEEFPESIGSQFEQKYRQAISENIPVHFEAYDPAIEIWVEVRACPTEDGLIVYFLDITKHKKTEEARQESETQLREQAQQLQLALHQLQATQSQLVQHEKMSSLGQLVAGIAHEINNPVNFIYGNLNYANAYAKDLLNLLALYEKNYPEPNAEIQNIAQNIELEFVRSDFPNLVESMRIGAERIRQIVISLRNFARLDEDGLKAVDLQEGIDSTLLILQHRLKYKDNHPGIQVIKNYSSLPSVECFPGQLNQVFMHLISNAIDAIEEHPQFSIASPDSPTPTLWISTKLLKRSSKVAIKIRDNGIGMSPETIARLFDPFFTTKPVGKGTGLGLSICYQIIVNHHRGQISCTSEPGKGSEFTIELPIFRRH